MSGNFVFFHGYDPVLWQGYEKRGLLRRGFGVRFCQSIMLPEGKKFNSLAAPGAAFDRLLSGLACPFYIDRLQGGTYIEKYPYDQSLIDRCEELSRGGFYGFQMHEWMSNLRSDYGKLKRLDADRWTEEGITSEIKRLFPYKYLFLEAADAREYAEDFPPPQDRAAFGRSAERLFSLRQAQTRGRLLPCDSAMMAPALEFRLGAERVMPEIGAQTAGTAIQLAYARGMARALGRSFGAYYEPWGGRPFSVCCCFCGGANEWNIGAEGDFPFHAIENGGSSRSLQRRLYLYAFLAGASFMSEEWGLYNTFLDARDFELSPYGAVKSDFLRFAEDFPRGEFYAPAAIVLPAGLSSLDDACSSPEPWAAGIRKLMHASRSSLGNETSSLINSDLPDAFDILHADREDALGGYRMLVDLTGDPAFARRHKTAVTPDEAAGRIYDLMPCLVSGGLHWFLLRSGGGWQLAVFNNDGIDMSAERGEIRLPEAAKTARIDIKNLSRLEPIAGSGRLSRDGGGYLVDIEPGEYFLAGLV